MVRKRAIHRDHGYGARHYGHGCQPASQRRDRHPAGSDGYPAGSDGYPAGSDGYPAGSDGCAGGHRALGMRLNGSGGTLMTTVPTTLSASVWRWPSQRGQSMSAM